MRVRITPGPTVEGTVRVPGDKSIAHRWLILAATARGRSALVDLPGSLDVRSTASSLAGVSGKAGPALEAWASNDPSSAEGHGSTWNVRVPGSVVTPLEVEGEGRAGLIAPTRDLDCGNAGTAMRLLAGVMASAPYHSVLTGDGSLRARPMDRVAEPLRAMGAGIETDEGHAPLRIDGGGLVGITYPTEVPTAQVKSAILFAGLDADGLTTVVEPAPTRDHTERAIRALGGPILLEGSAISVSRFQHDGFDAAVPGDPSSAAFLVAAAAISGSELTIDDLGLNPTRLHYLEVLARMGVRTERRIEREELGEPVGQLWVAPCPGLRSVRVEASEIPLIIDEIPMLAMLAQLANGDSRFSGAGELKVKESDRLTAIAQGIIDLGGHAGVEGDDLVVVGGGLDGGRAVSGGDHRMAMALIAAAIGARGPVEVEGAEVAAVSFPGFVETLSRLGASIEVLA
ncbi:MAG TPA: 3-phosphoshikimate 1-carboxyvinyltransferase [Actinomycetota bacterium]